MFSIKHMLGAIGLTATLIDICSGNTLPLEPCNIRLPDQRCLNRHGVPFSIRYSGPNNASMDMNGPDYDALDIFALVRFTKIPDDESIPDHEYYAYTPENIAASGVAWWYAGWTISAQKRPEWKDVGEWGLFAREFLDTRNLVCSLEDHGCGGHLQEDFIKSRYKDKRIFGRLVLFQALRMSDERNKYVAILDELTIAQLNTLSYATKTVTTFTHQANPDKINMCRLLKETIKSTARLGAGIAAAGLGGTSPPKISLMKSTSITASLFKVTLSPGNHKSDYKLIAAFNPFGKTIEAVPGWVEKAYDQNLKSIVHDSNGMHQGHDTDILCSSFEGGDANRNPKNIVVFQEKLVGVFDDLRKDIRKQFRGMTRGIVLLEGAPSAFAMRQFSQDLNGTTTRKNLHDMTSVRQAIQVGLAKIMAAETSAGDGNYIMCSHDPQASMLCAQGQYARDQRRQGKPTLDANGYEISKATQSLFCPEPEDSAFICQAGRIYSAKVATHVVPYSSVQKMESFRPELLNMTWESAMTEAYQTYKQVGNSFDSTLEGFASGNVFGIGFRAPFCVNDILQIKDFEQVGLTRGWEVPACCGKQCCDTQEFLSAIGWGIGSNYHKLVDKITGQSVQVFEDRIPRILERLNPFVRYLGWNRAGIVFPDQTSWFHRFYNGIDDDYQLIVDATRGKIDFEGALWFCRDGVSQHTIFSRERNYVQLHGIERRIKNSRDACNKWLAENRRDIKRWDAGDKRNLK